LVLEVETMNISTDMLQAFVKVADRLSVSAAAVDLGVGKGVVSKRLAQLEEAVKATLLTRNSRKLALTPAGQVYIVFARRAIDAVQLADEGLRTLRTVPTGQIRVTAPVSWGFRALGKALPDFLARYPEIEIELILQDRMLDIAAENIDIGLRMTAIPAPDLVSIPVAQLDWLMCASPHYLATSGEPHTPGELVHHPCMNYWSAQSDDAWHLRRGAEDLKTKVRNRYRANNPEVIVDAAVAGQGIALLPLYCCREEIFDGRLVQVLKDWSPVTKFGNQITAVVAPDRIAFSRNQAFLQFLKERFGAGA
jgi:DNA-binding transcriptional LysR family regulator